MKEEPDEAGIEFMIEFMPKARMGRHVVRKPGSQINKRFNAVGETWQCLFEEQKVRMKVNMMTERSPMRLNDDCGGQSRVGERQRNHVSPISHRS
jgi:hypothetical protein